jgi:hypothetical protein
MIAVYLCKDSRGIRNPLMFWCCISEVAKGNVNVKIALEQAIKAQKGSRAIALLFL